MAVLDYGTDPSNPVIVSKLQNPPEGSGEDVVAFTARYGPMAGRDIAAVRIQVFGVLHSGPPRARVARRSPRTR